jgi:NAD(P)-dependent dehydrogenase (short-subunit alcohol dehydrogenase family)
VSGELRRIRWARRQSDVSTVVVTGSASGIGRALATQLAAEGFRVPFADLAPTAELAADLGGIPHSVDVSRPEDMARVADEAPEADIVCLNVGIVDTSVGAPWEPRPRSGGACSR